MIEIIKFQFSETDLMRKSHKIRHEVFVNEQECPEKLEWELEEECTHFLVFEDEKEVATARHRKTKKGYKLERFAVLKSERGNGYGHIILKAILDDLSDFKGMIYMHAQVDVIPFYEKMGFIKEGKLFEEANIMHYKMTLRNKKFID